jgi:phosphoheptose isomerase
LRLSEAFLKFSDYFVSEHSFDGLEDQINIALHQLAHCILENKNVWIAGNGGSASTAEHFETDLLFIKTNS